MKEIGTQLKEAREKRKLSIQDVAIATKINIKIVKAIEEGDPKNLPAKPFLRGFVQTYARYLELNVDDVMKRFLEAHGSTKPKPQITEGGQADHVNHEEVQNKFELYKKIAYVVAAIIAIVCIYFIQKVVSRYEQESKIAKEQKEVVKSQLAEIPMIPAAEGPKTEEQNKKEEATAAALIAKASEVKTEVKSEEKIDEKKLLEEKKLEEKKLEEKRLEDKKIEDKKLEEKKAEDKKIEEKKLADEKKAAEAKKIEDKKAEDAKKLEDKKLEEKKKADDKKAEDAKKLEEKKLADEKKAADLKKAADEKKIADDKKAADLKKAAAATPLVVAPAKPVDAEKNSGKPQQLIIEALDNVEIRYTKDGEGERTVKLKPEQFLTIKANSKINLNVSDSGAVNIIHNGRDKGVPGNLGQPTKINYP